MRKVLFIIFMVVVLFTLGCTDARQQESNQVTNKNANTDALDKEYDYSQDVPELVLEYNNESVDAVRGTYSWNIEKGDEGTYIEADSGPPEELIKHQEQQITINEATDIHLVFDRDPASYTVLIWNEENYELSEEIDVFDNNISININQTCTIYEVIANFSFDNDLKEAGTVYYAFIVNEYNQDISSNIVVAGKGGWLNDKADTSDVVVIVSNQSFDFPKIKISGNINGVSVFDDEFLVGNQHEYSYYFINADTGEYSFSINTEDITLNKKIEINEDGPLWMYITYWNSRNENEHIDVLVQNEPVGLD